MDAPTVYTYSIYPQYISRYILWVYTVDYVLCCGVYAVDDVSTVYHNIIYCGVLHVWCKVTCGSYPVEEWNIYCGYHILWVYAVDDTTVGNMLWTPSIYTVGNDREYVPWMTCCGYHRHRLGTPQYILYVSTRCAPQYTRISCGWYTVDIIDILWATTESI